MGLEEIEEHWSLDDLWLAHEWLDAYDEAEVKQHERLRPKTKTPRKGGRGRRGRKRR